MHFDLDEMDAKPRHNLLAALVVPRPIAWVTSLSAAGALNAAPFSFFNLMSGSPPILCLGIETRDGKPKDTARNIEETGEFVVNMVSRDLAGQMVVTAIDFDAGVDEVAEAGLALEPSSHVRPPRLAASPAALECRMTQIITIGTTRSIVIATVLAVEVADKFLLNPARGHVDTPALELVGRMHAGAWYATTVDCFRIPRIPVGAWASIRQAPQDR
jgi:flavin reductase (DIM6/NTAB) family NADH-FMN oxidoreductase RutF